MFCAAPPYEGDEPYIFFSYCHDDEERVYPILEQMARDGFRVWYDNGTHPGAQWLEIIAQHLHACSSYIAVISKASADSHHCRDELIFAKNSKKKLIPILLESFSMTLGTKLLLSSSQFIKKYEMPDDASFFRKLYSAEGLTACRDEPQEISNREKAVIVRLSTGEFFQFYKEHNSIGRNEDCDIVIPLATISADHAVIQQNAGKFYLLDCDSANGTFLNAKRLDGMDIHCLEDFSVICLGEEDFIFASGEKAGKILSDQYISYLKYDETGEILPLGFDEIKLGRGYKWPNGALADGRVSHYHGTVVPIKHGFGLRLSDTETTNGTFLNDKKLVPGVRIMLNDGDRIGFGLYNHVSYHQIVLREAGKDDER